MAHSLHILHSYAITVNCLEGQNNRWLAQIFRSKSAKEEKPKMKEKVEKSSLLEDRTSQRKKREIIFEPFVSYICNYLKQAQMPLLKIKKTKPQNQILGYFLPICNSSFVGKLMSSIITSSLLQFPNLSSGGG